MSDQEFYARPGALTTFTPQQAAEFAELGSDPIEICLVARGLVIEPADAAEAGITTADGDRVAERNIRSAGGLADVLLELAPGPLTTVRPPAERVMGTCRHFAVLACALLRLRGIPARARCGFATYFFAGRSVDHWVVEYWHLSGQRWVRVEVEYLSTSVVDDPSDLPSGAFLTGGEAWREYRAGRADPDTFGVVGFDHAWGIGEIRGNAIRDLASLNKIEMLPWDEWGRMDDSYHGRTGPEYDDLMDVVAAACASAAPSEVIAASAREDLAVPLDMQW